MDQKILKFEFCDFKKEFLKFSKRRRVILLRPIWTIMVVAAKLDQSRVLVAKFRQNRLTLKDSSAGQRYTDKPVGLYGPIAPPVPNAPSSECRRVSIAARRRAAGSIRISRRASCCCSRAIAGIAIGANFQIYLLRQFFSNRVEFFYNTQKTQTQKMMDQNFEIQTL